MPGPDGQSRPDGPTQMLRMAIEPDGSYAKSEWLDVRDSGARKLYNIARPSADAGEPRGPAFAVLPIRPDPASQFGTCFLMNTENLVLGNPWTAADWDAFEADGFAPPPPLAAGGWPDGDFELLVAAAQGKVFHVRRAEGHTAVSEVDLHTEPEIWAQLREGVVVGTVKYEEIGRILPIVNVTSLKVRNEGGAR
jgi:hypothetical protein